MKWWLTPGKGWRYLHNANSVIAVIRSPEHGEGGNETIFYTVTIRDCRVALLLAMTVNEAMRLPRRSQKLTPRNNEALYFVPMNRQATLIRIKGYGSKD